mmetsp:Transcript_28949/g.69888  ORF Transcript_28949/g.69888 Transcript_28949/m.69888 type:complete len:292 (+) Transcript_28949:103-978(+)
MKEHNNGHQKLDDNDANFSFQQQQPSPRIKVTPLVATNDSWVTLYENVLSPQDSLRLLQELSQELPWNVETDQFGPQSRPTCYFADPDCTFSYVGLKLDPAAPNNNKDDDDDSNNNKYWHPTVQKLRERVTLAAADQLLTPATTTTNESSSPLTACLVNLYPKGEGFIPWHYDEIRAHGKDKIVASLSLGGPRRFQLRTRVAVEKSDAKQEEKPRMVADLWLPSGSVLLMKGEVQENYEHCLPLETAEPSSSKTKQSQDDVINPLRISLTFRSIVPGYENDRSIATDQCCT